MAITLYTGLPRSGKTYRTVNDIVTRFFDYDAENSEYVLKPVHKKTFIATNIKGLSDSLPNLWDWEQLLLDKHIKFQEFFTEAFQKELMAEGGYEKCFYVFDDCSKYFRRISYDKEEVENYMDIHGHLGHNIYFITRHRTKIAKGLVNLCELEIRALAKSTRFGKELKYIHYVGGMFPEKTGYSVLTLDSRISSLYFSADVAGSHGDKLRNPVMIYIVLTGCCILLLCYFLYSFFYGFDKGKDLSQAHAEVSGNIQKQDNKDDIYKLRKKIFSVKKDDSVLSGWKNYPDYVCLYNGDERFYFVLDDTGKLVPLDIYKETHDFRIIGNQIYLKLKSEDDSEDLTVK